MNWFAGVVYPRKCWPLIGSILMNDSPAGDVSGIGVYKAIATTSAGGISLEKTSNFVLFYKQQQHFRGRNIRIYRFKWFF